MEQHDGKEFLVVLEGTVEVHSAFHAPVTLQKSEFIYLDSTMGHAYLSAGPGDAEVICVCTDPQRLPSESRSGAMQPEQ